MIAARTRRPVLRIRPTSLACGVIAAAAMLAAPLRAHAATYTHLDNTTGLNLSGAWSTGGPPTSADAGEFSGTYNTAGSLSGTFGTTASWGGIIIGNIVGTATTGTVTIGGTGNAITNSNFTIGSLGIDMSGANQNLILNSSTFTVNTSQTWNIAAGRSVRFGSTFAIAGNALLTGTNANARVTVSGGGVVDLNPGGTGLGGYAGKWQVNAGTTLRTQQIRSAALGTNTAADALILNGGTLATGGPSGGGVGNWTFNMPITLADGVASGIDNQMPSGSNRWLKLEMAISGATLNTGTLVFRNTQSSVMGNDQYSFILAGTSTFLGGMTISANTYVRLGGSNIGTADANAGNNGALAAGLAISNSGVFRLTRNDTWTFANAVSGTGQLKVGGAVGTTTSQVVNMTGTSTYTGATTIENGTLVLAANGQLGSTGTYAGNIANAGIFRVATTVNQALSGTISGTGALTQAGPGTLSLSGANTFTGDTLVSAGTIAIGNALALQNSPLDTSGAGSVSLDAGVTTLTLGGLKGSTNLATQIASGYSSLTALTLNVASGVSGTYSGVIANGAAGMSLTKTGAGTQAITAAQTYTGTTTVQSGTLAFSSSGAINLNSEVVVAAGATLTTSVNNTFGNSSSQAPWTVAGTVLGTANAQTIPSVVTLNSGTLGGSAGSAFGTFLANQGNKTIISNGTSAISSLRFGLITTATFSTPLATDTLNVSAVLGASSALGGGIVKAGLGTVTLSGSSMYTGGTRLDAGTLSFGTNSLGTDTVTLNGGTLQWATGNSQDLSSRLALVSGSTATLDTNGNNVTFASSFGGTTSAALVKIGAGTLALSASNSWSGGTTLSAGQLNINNPSAIGTGTFTISSGTIDNTSGGGIVLATNNPQNWGGDFTFTGSNPLDLGTGTVTLTANRQVTVTSSTLTVGGAVGGAFSLTKAGNGTLVLSGSSTYSGTTTISGGVLAIAGNVSLGSNVAGVSASTLRFGANTITIGTSVAGDSSSTYNGTVDGTGTIRLRGGSNTVMGVDGTTGTSGNGFSIVPATAQMPPTAFALDTGASATDRKDFGFRNDTGDVLTLSSLTGFGAIRGDGNGNGTPRFITVNQATDTTFNGAIVSSVSTGTVYRPITFEKQGAGTLTLAGFIGKQTISTLSGSVAAVNLIANGGLLLVTNTFNSTTTNTDAINSSGTVTITSGTLGFAPQALINTAGTQGVASIRMNGGVLQWYGTNTQDITAGSRFVLVNSQTATLDTNGNNVTLATGFGGTTSAVVVKNGAGTLTLSASNSWSGGTTLNAGMLSFGTNGLGTTGNVTLNSGTLQWATGNSQDISARLTLVSGGTAVLDNNGNSVTLGSAFGGSTTAALTSLGSGTLRLAGANTYTGVTTINAGVLSVSSLANGGAASPVGASAATAGNLVIGSGATLVLESGAAASSTDRLFTLAGSGTVLNNDATAADTLSFTNTGTIGHSGNGTRTLALGGTNGGTNVFAPTLTNNPNDASAVSFRKAGSSTWSITGTANSYTGANTLAGGTVIVQKLANGNANSSLGASSSVESNLVLNGVSLTYQGGGDTTDRAFRISSNSTINASGSGALTWSGSGIGFGTINTAYTLTLGGTSTAANTFGTPLRDNGTGALSLAKSNAGTWVVTSSNSYTGGSTVNAGTLVLGSTNALGTGAATFAGSALVQANVAGTFTNAIVVNTSQTGTFDTQSNTNTLSGVVSGAGSFVKAGAGTLTLSNANTFTGGFVLTGGTAIAGNGTAFGRNSATSGAITIRNGTLNLNGQFNYTHTNGSVREYLLNNSALTFGGVAGATMLLTDTAATPYGFGTFNTNGQIVYDATNNPGTATVAAAWRGVGASGVVTKTVTVGDSTATAIELDFTGQMSMTTTDDGIQTTIQKLGAGTMRISAANFFPGLRVTAGTLIVNNTNALGSFRTYTSGVTTTTQNLVTVDGGTLDLNGFSPAIGGLTDGAVTTGTVTNNAVGASTLTTGSSNVALTFGGRIADGAGTVALTKLGTAALTLSGSNGYSGGTTLSSGTIIVGSTNALGSGPVAVNAGTLNLNGQSVSFGLLTGSSGGSITSSAAGSVTLTSNAATSGTFAGTIASGSGTVGFAKAGAGTLTLGGANTYTGATTITAGTLAVSSDSNLGTAPGSATVGQLAINGGALSATAGFTLNSNRGLAVGPSSGSGNGTIHVASGTLAYGGIVANNGAGTGGLVKDGPGLLQLTGVNTYSGPTTISSGTVEVGGAGQLGGGSYAGAITNNAALAFTTSANQSLSGGMTGSGSLAKSGASTLTIQGNNDYSGVTTVSGGSLVVNGAITASAMTVSGGAILAGSGSAANVTLAGGVISPGNSPGNLTLGNLSWDATSSYKWEMYDYALTAGTGWDLITGTGTLTVTGTGFTFNLVSLSALPNTVGPAAGWSQTTSGTFRVGTFSGGITTPSGQWWTVNTGSFTPFSTLTGSFSVSTTANDMFLVYTYTPPPAYVWTAGDGSWSTGTNWSTDPLVPAGTADIIFSGTGGASVNDITSGTGAGELSTVSSLTFSGSASGPYTISGNGFTLGSGGIVNQSASTQTVQNDLTLGAGSLADAQTADLVLSGSVVTAGYNFSVTGSSNTLISGVVTGSGGLAKLGAGTLTLSGSSDFTGGTTITSGSLVVGDGATAGVLPGSVTNNAVLGFNRSDDVTFAGTIGGTGALVKLNTNTLALSGSNSYSGATTISGGTLAFTSTANQSLVGAISGSGGLAKGGASTLTLTAVNTYAGDTTISSGTLAIGGAGQLGGGSYAGAIANAGVLSVATTADQTLAGAISGTGSLVKSAAGTLTLTGTSTYTGSTTISTGTLVIGGAGQLGGGSYAGAISNAGTLSVASTANQTLSGTVSGAGVLVKSAAGTLTLTAPNTFTGGVTLSAGTIRAGNNAALGTGTATLNGGTLSSDGATARTLANVLAIGGGVTLGDATNNGLLTFSGSVGLGGGSPTVTTASDVTISGVLNNGGLVKAGPGTLRLTNANTYTLGTTIASGTVVVANASAVGTSGTVTLNSAATGAANTSFLIDASVTSITIARPITVANQGSGVTMLGSAVVATGSSAIFSGAVTLAKDITLYSADTGAAGRTQFSGGIGGTGNVSVTTVGSGRVIFLTTANTFSGNLTISPNSILQLSDATATTNSLIPDTADVTIGAGGTLRIAKGPNSESINALLGSGTVTGFTSTPTLVVGASGGSGTFTGVLTQTASGTLALTKEGAGTQVLSGVSNYTGATTVSAGTLQLFGSGSLSASTTLTVADAAGATFDLNGLTQVVAGLNGGGASGGSVLLGSGTLEVAKASGTDTFAGVVDGSGRLVKSGAGTLALHGSNTYSGDTTISSGTLEIGGAGQLGSGAYAGTIVNNGALSFASSANQIISGTITGSGLLSKSGAGTLTLTAANTYAGSTTISAGTLALSGIGGISATSLLNLSVSGATLDMSAADGNRTLTNLTGAAGSALILGSNSLTVSSTSDSTFSGVISGSGSLTKTGVATLTLGGANTFTGGISLNAGTLQAGNANALGSGTLTINSGTLTTGGTQLALPNNIVLATNATFAGTAGTQGMRLDGIISGTGSITKEGTGRVTLIAANTFTGSTTINAGILAVTLNALASSTSTHIAGTTSGGLAIGSNGTTTINNLTGTVDGRIRSDFSISGDGARALAVNQSIDGTFDGTFTQGGATRPISLIKSGTAVLTLTNATNVYSGTTTVNAGTLRIGGAGRLNNGSYAGAIAIAEGAVFRFDSTAAQTLSGVISGSGTLRVSNTGTLTLSNANTYTGATLVDAGVLALGASDVLSNSTAVTVAGGALNLATFADTVASVSITSGSIIGSGTLTAATYGLGGGTVNGNLGAGTLNVTADSSLNGTSAASAVNLGSGTLALGSGGRFTSSAVAVSGSSGAAITLGGNEAFGSLEGAANVALGGSTLSVGAANTSTSYSGIISGGGGLTKAGGGSLTLSAASAYTGLTTVSGGTLALSSGGSIQSSSGVNLSASGAALDISAASGDRTIGSLAGAAGSVVVLGGNTLTAGDATSTTFGGGLSGSGDFTKSGSGVLTLSAAQSLFTGDVNVLEGSLKINGANYLQQVADRIFVADNATLDGSAAGLTVFSGQTLGGYGTADVGAGSLVFNSGASLSPGGSVGQFDATGNVTFNGGMNYLFEINDGNGTPGVSPGWDLFTATGALTLAASGSNQINVDVAALSGASIGPAADFDQNFNYAWKFVVAGSEISSFNTGWFNVNASAFTLQNPASGSFYVARGDQIGAVGATGGTSSELYVVYAAVPEPSTVVLAGIGLIVAGYAAGRRRRRRGSAA